MSLRIRPARVEDQPAIEQIEELADTLLINYLDAVGWPPPSSASERASLPGFTRVAEMSNKKLETPKVVGFIHVLEIDNRAHLEQLSVLPEFGRRGIGRKLVSTALNESLRRGHKELTLRTYAHVPWSAPFYASCGFVQSEPTNTFLRELVEVEAALGLFEHGPRVQMTAVLQQHHDDCIPT